MVLRPVLAIRRRSRLKREQKNPKANSENNELKLELFQYDKISRILQVTQGGCAD